MMYEARKYIKEYIKNSSLKARKNSKERHIFGQIPVYLLNDFLLPIDIDYVLRYIENRVPKRMATNIVSVQVGDFKEFNKNNRNFNAMYEKGVLYISNDQDNEEDMIDDIVHEIAHSVEEKYYDYIYLDKVIEREFLWKRKRLYKILKQENFWPQYNWFLNTEYNANFDNYLYREIGYQTLNMLIVGLFYSPYAATSLREYFANGFENYFLGDKKTLKEVSPHLYKRINKLIEGEDVVL